MHIMCPHCTTSYAIDLANLGAAGRTVRCSRCKEVWLARPEDAVEILAPEPAMAQASAGSANEDAAAEWEALAREDDSDGVAAVGAIEARLLARGFACDVQRMKRAGNLLTNLRTGLQRVPGIHAGNQRHANNRQCKHTISKH